MRSRKKEKEEWSPDPEDEGSQLEEDVNCINQGQKISNTTYARVKVFRRPLIAKMLEDSGNLVHD